MDQSSIYPKTLREILNDSTEPFENVNIYPMIAHILGIDPSKKIDGNLNNIKHLLK